MIVDSTAAAFRLCGPVMSAALSSSVLDGRPASITDKTKARCVLFRASPHRWCDNWIPPATPWDELEKHGSKVSVKTKSIRGKLNVSRERFRWRPDGVCL
jgi:hypothetical protein